MTESIGTARLDIVVNTDGMQAGVEAAKRSVSGMSAAAQQEYSKLNAAEKRRVDSLIRQVDTLNLTRQGQLAYNAALKTSGSVQAELLARIKATEVATRSGAAALNQYGISAKQSAAAMRGVPAQLTDIFTSLQGGQNPLTVLLQQGGQLKDMFGGIVPAARALGGALTSLITPYTAVAAAAGVLAVAWTKAEGQTAAYNRALIGTGGFADRTAEQLDSLAGRLDDIAGVTKSSAAGIIASVAQSGQFAGAVFDMVAEAAVRASESGIKSADEVVAAFREIGRDPVDALLKLNQAEHFLTETQLDRIQALQDEGRHQDAVAEAVRIYFDVISSRSGQAREQITTMAEAWRTLKESVTEAGDGIVEAVAAIFEAYGAVERRSTAMLQNQRTALESNLFSAQRSWIVDQNQVDELEGKISAIDRELSRRSASAGRQGPEVVDSPKAQKAREERKRAEDEWGRWQQQNLSRQQKQLDEEKRIQAAGEAIGKKQSEIDAQIAASRKRYQESLPRGSRGRKGVSDEEREAKALQRAYESQSEQMSRQIALFDDTTRAAAVRYETEKGALSALSKDKKDALIAQAETLDAMRAEKDLAEDLKRLREDLAATELGRGRANEADLLGLTGVGREEFERIQRRLEIEEEYQDRVADLIAGGLEVESEAFRKQEAELRAHRDRSLTVEEDYQQKRAALMGDWRTGATAALNDFVADQANVAGQMYDIWSGAFEGLSDVITDFLTKGKGDFKGFLNALAADITEFVVKQQLSKFFQSMMGGDQGGGANGGQMIGSLFSMFGGGWGGIAMGGAFGGGQRIDKYAMGGVFDQATMFQHGGKLGVLGEAGPEAIMPLHRGRDGKLGVKVDQREASGRSVPVTMNQTFVVQGSPDGRTREQMARTSGREAARGIARTGR